MRGYYAQSYHPPPRVAQLAPRADLLPPLVGGPPSPPKGGGGYSSPLWAVCHASYTEIFVWVCVLVSNFLSVHM